eukprot:4172672-Lingulodinium_polyedra.AAC.1
MSPIQRSRSMAFHASLLGDEVLRGKKTLQAFSVWHHKSAARLITLHLLLNNCLEEPPCVGCQQNAYRNVD